MAERYEWQELSDGGAQYRTELMLLAVDKHPKGEGWRITVYANGHYVRRQSPDRFTGARADAKTECMKLAKRLLHDELACIEESEGA